MIDYNQFLLHSNKLTILLVEDYIPLRDELVELLEEFFYSVEVASNGEEALSIYRDKSRYFDIIISDIEMPIKNGLEMSKEIYKINPKQSIIILSSHTDSNYLINFINLGISRFITKPIDYEIFIQSLYKVSSEISIVQANNSKNIVSLHDGYIWDKESSVLKKSGTIISLTKNEILLMRLMIIKINSVCTNRDIVDYLYAENIDFNESSIRNLVSKLRKKLPSSNIDTIYGMGYQLKI